MYLDDRLVENAAFLIGSAYFVAGSYPDVALSVGDEFLDTSHDTDDVEAVKVGGTATYSNPLVKNNNKK